MTRHEIADARPFRELRGELAARLERGDSLERVERELIVPSGLSEDLQSALWLYAWALRRPAQRKAPRGLVGAGA